MTGSVLGIVLGVGAVLLGARGFSAGGLPYAPGRSLRGGPARVIGFVLLLMGAGFLFLSAFSLAFLTMRR